MDRSPSFFGSSQNTLRRFCFDERGASLALVAISLVWMVAMVSLVVDIGGGWLTRQSLIPATDAAALAAAQDLVAQPWNEAGACATAGAYLVANEADATMVECAVTWFGNGGRITVTATDDLETNFSAAEQDITIQSVSSAAWGSPSTVTSLRPLALCYDGSAELRDVIDNPPSSPTLVTVAYPKDDPADCGGPVSTGNFATVDFEGGASTSEIRSWTLYGFPGQITFDPETVLDCAAGAVCYGRPYASVAIIGELNTLRYNQSYVAFPVFNFTDSSEVHLIGMLRARIYDFNLYGDSDSQWIELKVEPGLVAGTCCGPPGLQSGNQVIAICGVDADAYDSCAPNAGP